MRWQAAALGLVTLGTLLGCGGSSDVKRYRVSGKVSFDGRPITHGEVLFTPDGAQMNSGAQGIATIRGGRFDTSSAGGKGYGGGPAVVRVTGLTGERGALLCEYEFRINLPHGNSTQDLVVPVQAGARAGKGPGGI